MCKTPKTPSKTNYQATPITSEIKRSLFQSENLNEMEDDLGLLSPLSPSSCSSNQVR